MPVWFEKIIDFLQKYINNLWFLSALSVGLFCTYHIFPHNLHLLAILYLAVTFWLFSALHHIYDKIQFLRKQHLNKLRDYALYKKEHVDILKDIYSNLDKLERQYFYKLFFEKEIILPFRDFYLDSSVRSRRFSEISYTPDRQLEYEEYGNKDKYDYILWCYRWDQYSTPTGCGWHSCRLVMNNEFKEEYKSFINHVKNFVEENE